MVSPNNPQHYYVLPKTIENPTSQSIPFTSSTTSANNTAQASASSLKFPSFASLKKDEVEKKLLAERKDRKIELAAPTADPISMTNIHDNPNDNSQALPNSVSSKYKSGAASAFDASLQLKNTNNVASNEEGERMDAYCSISIFSLPLHIFPNLIHYPYFIFIEIILKVIMIRVVRSYYSRREERSY